MPIEIAPGPMTGTLDTTVLDPKGVLPSSIIRTTDGWSVKVAWTLKGAGAAFVSPNERWTVRVFIESIGPGREALMPPPVTVNAIGGTNQEYAYTFTFAADPSLADPRYSGVYKVVTVLTLSDGAGNPLPVAGFSEGPIIQFYRPA